MATPTAPGHQMSRGNTLRPAQVVSAAPVSPGPSGQRIARSTVTVSRQHRTGVWGPRFANPGLCWRAARSAPFGQTEARRHTSGRSPAAACAAGRRHRRVSRRGLRCSGRGRRGPADLQPMTAPGLQTGYPARGVVQMLNCKQSLGAMFQLQKGSSRLNHNRPNLPSSHTALRQIPSSLRRELEQ